MKYVRIACLLTALTLSALMTGCTHAVKPESSSSGQSQNLVSMSEFKFRPESLNVFTGDTVTWVNKGTFPHTTTSGVNGKPDGLWASADLPRGKSFSYVFTRPGTYPYFCMPHHGLGMKGVVVVTSR
jgi:manganese oxidase